jgi:hypothetical protein
VTEHPNPINPAVPFRADLAQAVRPARAVIADRWPMRVFRLVKRLHGVGSSDPIIDVMTNRRWLSYHLQGEEEMPNILSCPTEGESGVIYLRH